MQNTNITDLNILVGMLPGSQLFVGKSIGGFPNMIKIELHVDWPEGMSKVDRANYMMIWVQTLKERLPVGVELRFTVTEHFPLWTLR